MTKQKIYNIALLMTRSVRLLVDRLVCWSVWEVIRPCTYRKNSEYLLITLPVTVNRRAPIAVSRWSSVAVNRWLSVAVNGRLSVAVHRWLPIAVNRRFSNTTSRRSSVAVCRWRPMAVFVSCNYSSWSERPALVAATLLAWWFSQSILILNSHFVIICGLVSNISNTENKKKISS